MTKPKSNRRSKPDGACTIPTHIPVDFADKVAFGRDEHAADEIRRYVSIQTNGEAVNHLEKMVTEVVHDRQVEGWNVWTDKSQYWVVTNPTNLYEQRLFPSLDYTITFHIGPISSSQSARAETRALPRRAVPSALFWAA